MADLLNIVTSSEKRKSLLLLLSNGPRTWDEIKTELNVTATGMLPQIKILEEEGLIVRESRVHSLTALGKLIVHHMIPFTTTLTTIELQKKFWHEHDIGALPEEFLLRIGEIREPRIIETSLEESFKPHNQFLGTILRSRHVAGITPFVHPVYPRFFLSVAEKGHEVQLILTKNAFEKIKKEYAEILLSGLQYTNARLWVYKKDLRFSSIITDNFLSLGLFSENEIFDSKRDLVSSDPSSVKWGEDLFAYYMNKSSRVNREGRY